MIFKFTKISLFQECYFKMMMVIFITSNNGKKKPFSLKKKKSLNISAYLCIYY